MNYPTLGTPQLKLTMTWPIPQKRTFNKFELAFDLPTNRSVKAVSTLLDKIDIEVNRANALRATISAELSDDDVDLPADLLAQIISKLSGAKLIGVILGITAADITAWKRVQSRRGKSYGKGISESKKFRLTYFASHFKKKIRGEENNILRYHHLKTGKEILKKIFELLEKNSHREISDILNEEKHSAYQEFNNGKFNYTWINKLYNSSAVRLGTLRPNKEFRERMNLALSHSTKTRRYLRIDPIKENEDPGKAISVAEIQNSKIDVPTEVTLRSLPFVEPPSIIESDNDFEGAKLQMYYKQGTELEKALMVFIYNNSGEIVFSKRIETFQNPPKEHTIDLFSEAGLPHGYYIYQIVEEDLIGYGDNDIIENFKFGSGKDTIYQNLLGSFSLGLEVYRLPAHLEWKINYRKGKKVVIPTKKNSGQ